MLMRCSIFFFYKHNALSFFRVHHGQITSNQVLLPVIDNLRKITVEKVTQLRVCLFAIILFLLLCKYYCDGFFFLFFYKWMNFNFLPFFSQAIINVLINLQYLGEKMHKGFCRPLPLNSFRKWRNFLASNFSSSDRVFKILVQQTRKKKGFFWKDCTRNIFKSSNLITFISFIHVSCSFSKTFSCKFIWYHARGCISKNYIAFLHFLVFFL